MQGFGALEGAGCQPRFVTAAGRLCCAQGLLGVVACSLWHPVSAARRQLSAAAQQGALVPGLGPLALGLRGSFHQHSRTLVCLLPADKFACDSIAPLHSGAPAQQRLVWLEQQRRSCGCARQQLERRQLAGMKPGAQRAARLGTSGLVNAGDSSSSASARPTGAQRATSSAAARASRASPQSTQRSTCAAPPLVGRLGQSCRVGPLVCGSPTRCARRPAPQRSRAALASLSGSLRGAGP